MKKAECEEAEGIKVGLPESITALPTAHIRCEVLLAAGERAAFMQLMGIEGCVGQTSVFAIT